MKFTKMQGIGNDFIVINNIEENISNPSDLAIRLCDRHFGIGADGILLIDKSNIADYKMRLFNADGSEAEMCGNGIRCIGTYVKQKLLDKNIINIETLAGIKVLEIFDNRVKVDMGEPILNSKLIPIVSEKDKVINESFIIDGEVYNITAVSMGNPHAVIFVNKIDEIEIEKTGKKIEFSTHIFPKKTNVEFIELVDRGHIKMKVWERGVGETLACGTGACASAVAAILNKKTDNNVEVALLGGKLNIELADDNHVYMTGNADIVFEGEI